jgi:hypothetical protein
MTKGQSFLVIRSWPTKSHNWWNACSQQQFHETLDIVWTYETLVTLVSISPSAFDVELFYSSKRVEMYLSVRNPTTEVGGL